MQNKNQAGGPNTGNAPENDQTTIHNSDSNTRQNSSDTQTPEDPKIPQPEGHREDNDIKGNDDNASSNTRGQGQPEGRSDEAEHDHESGQGSMQNAHQQQDAGSSTN